MSYEDLMARITREIPELAGQLSAPRVTFVKSLQKTYISFESAVLAGEKQFLRLERILREVFPGHPLSVRVVSRGLKDSFLEDPAPYRQVLDDFLRRNYPSSAGWIGQIHPTAQKAYGLKHKVFAFEIELAVLQKARIRSVVSSG